MKLDNIKDALRMTCQKNEKRREGVLKNKRVVRQSVGRFEREGGSDSIHDGRDSDPLS
jgi:hypothetical protein